SRISPPLVTKLIGAVMVAEFENCSSREIADAYRGGRVDRVIPRIVSEGGHQWIEDRRGTSREKIGRAPPRPEPDPLASLPERPFRRGPLEFGSELRA